MAMRHETEKETGDGNRTRTMLCYARRVRSGRRGEEKRTEERAYHSLASRTHAEGDARLTWSGLAQDLARSVGGWRMEDGGRRMGEGRGITGSQLVFLRGPSQLWYQLVNNYVSHVVVSCCRKSGLGGIRNR